MKLHFYAKGKPSFLPVIPPLSSANTPKLQIAQPELEAHPHVILVLSLETMVPGDPRLKEPGPRALQDPELQIAQRELRNVPQVDLRASLERLYSVRNPRKCNHKRTAVGTRLDSQIEKYDLIFLRVPGNPLHFDGFRFLRWIPFCRSIT